ncbi:DUF2184 domain-containing protein [Halovulum sp. GXIMD14793]
MNTSVLTDAQAALSFVVSQASHIETKVIEKDYPDLLYPKFIPIDTDANPFASSVTFFSQDRAGEAKLINGNGDDIPMVDILRNKHEETIRQGGIMYSFSVEEIGQAQMQGRSLSSEKAIAARDAYEQMLDNFAFVGANGVEGLTNHSGITSTAAAGAFSGLSADDVLAAINGQLTDIWASSSGIERANTILLPIAVLGDIATRRINATNDTTIYEFVQRKNVYTLSTGQPLMIEGCHHLTDRAVFYKRDPSVLKMHIPMALRFLPPQPRGLQIDTFGMFRFSGVNIRRPGAMRYLTGVA